MSELTEDELITKINTIDAQIASIVSVLGTSGQGGVQFVDYEIQNKSVDGSQRMAQLIEARKLYQGMLNVLPKSISKDHGYDVEVLTGVDRTEMQGDE